MKTIREIYTTLLSFLSKLEHVRYGNINLTEDIIFEKITIQKTEEVQVLEKKEKAQKGDSQRITLSLFKEGKSIKEIVSERNLSTTTIEGHLSGFILTGDLSVDKLISKDKQDYLIPRLKEIPFNTPLSSIKENLPKEYSYLDIKSIINHLRWLKSSSE